MGTRGVDSMDICKGVFVENGGELHLRGLCEGRVETEFDNGISGKSVDDYSYSPETSVLQTGQVSV